MPVHDDEGRLGELGFSGLPGHTESPRDLLAEVRQGEELGLGAVFLSERFDMKDVPTLCGAAAAASETIGIAAAATNHNTRHPMVTATFAATMNRLSGGRFTLGLGRGFSPQFRGMGLPPITTAQLEDATQLLRRLWRGETIKSHDGPAGQYPYLRQNGNLDEDIPVLLVALGEKSLEMAGRCMDAVVLHTFFGDTAVARSVAAVRRGAERAGRDPSDIRVWSVLATVPDHLDEAKRLKKIAGRLASYLQAYGDLLVKANGWDPVLLDRFRSDPFVKGFRGSFDSKATTSELEHVATLLPDEWTGVAASGTPQQCAAAVLHQFDLGVDSVLLHGATPAELAPVLPAYRAVRPQYLTTTPINPGRARR